MEANAKHNVSRSANGKMEVSFEKITPTKAKEYLDDFNHLNRSVTQSKVDQYVDLMLKGKFYCTTDAIAFSDSTNPLTKRSRLINGQHRLLGVIGSNTTQEFLVMRGVPDSTFEIIDTGKNRTSGDVLSTWRVPNPKQIAGIVGFILRFMNGSISNATNATSKGTQTISHGEVRDFALRNQKDLLNSREYGYDKYNKLVNPSHLSALHFIFKVVNRERADIFVNQLNTGENLNRESPVFILRHMLQENKEAQFKRTVVEISALIIKAWNAFYNGVKVERLKYARTEEFPEIAGLKEKKKKLAS